MARVWDGATETATQGLASLTLPTDSPPADVADSQHCDVGFESAPPQSAPDDTMPVMVATPTGGGSEGVRDGCPGPAAQFKSPIENAVAVDREEGRYVADREGRRARKLAPGGHTIPVAGDGSDREGFRDDYPGPRGAVHKPVSVPAARRRGVAAIGLGLLGVVLLAVQVGATEPPTQALNGSPTVDPVAAVVQRRCGGAGKTHCYLGGLPAIDLNDPGVCSGLSASDARSAQCERLVIADL